MTEIDTEKYRALLGAERDALEEELEKHGKKVGDDWQGSSAEFGNVSADPNEVADQIEELEVNTIIVEELEGRYRNVLAALERIEKGGYGICEVGGEPIDEDRLEANPAATACVEHAE